MGLRGRVKAALPLGVKPALLVLLGLILVGYFFGWRPYWEVEGYKFCLGAKNYLDLKNSVRTTAAQALGGAAVLIGLYFAWRNLRTAQEGQITERFTEAIKLLGSAKMEVRIGAIYALERISRDSSRDYPQIMEILTAFVRSNAPWPPRKPHKTEVTPGIRSPSADVQAILKVLHRRPAMLEQGGQTLDLGSTDLRGADLTQAQLERAYLQGSNLGGAKLERANLSNADLFGTSLVGTTCSETNFEGASFRDADLRDVKFYKTRLQGARLHDSNLTGAWFQEAHLEGAHLTGLKGVTQEMFHSSFGDKTTILPADVLRPAEWDHTEGPS
jgi:hypothetical protein